jgi:uncharacterized protein YeaO (DUF488 family)
MSRVRLKRVYDPPSPNDGVRVLVDRLWPRGLKRNAAKIDLWLKEVAPSAGLRRWFGHDPDRWVEFRKRYRDELAKNSRDVATLHNLMRSTKPLTLLFAAKDAAHNNAVALKSFVVSDKKPRTRQT